MFIWLFCMALIVRNVLEFNRVYRFDYFIPKNGRETMIPLLMVYFSGATTSLFSLFSHSSFSLKNLTLLSLFVAAFSIREWCSWQMKNNYSNEINPQGSFVVNSGMYSIVRHPIYLLYMLELVALVFINVTFLSLIIPALFFAILIVRMKREERYLVDHFGEDYVLYQKGSKKIIPFVY